MEILEDRSGKQILLLGNEGIKRGALEAGVDAATNILPFKLAFLLQAIPDNIPVKYKEINWQAFEGGMKPIKNPIANKFFCGKNEK